jgi:hypothetical protein
MRVTRISVLAILTLSAACYRYTPASVDAVPPDTDVRARLSAAEADRLSEYMPAESRVLEGKVLERNGDSILLLVPVLSELRGNRVQTLHQRLEVSRSGIVDLELRQLDRGKTGLIMAGGVAAVAAVVVNSVILGASSDRDRPGNGGSELVIRLPFRF